MTASSRWALPLVLLTSLSFAACDSGSSTPDPTPTPTPTVTAPTFAIASVPVMLADGSAGLQFAATPSASVTLSEVVITNPVGGVERFNAQNANVLSGSPFALQDDNVGYNRVSGTWTFRFVGARSPAVTNGNFDVTTTLPVSAFAPAAPQN